MGLGQDMLFLSQTNKGGLFTDRGKDSGGINWAHFTAELESCQGIRECCGDRREEKCTRVYSKHVRSLKRIHAQSNGEKAEEADQKSRGVARERWVSQRDLLLDRDSPLRVELQLQPSVSALDRAQHLTQHVMQFLFGWLEFELCVCVCASAWCTYESTKFTIYSLNSRTSVSQHRLHV